MRGRSLHRGSMEVKENLVLSSMTTHTDQRARGNAGSGCRCAPIRASLNLVLGCGLLDANGWEGIIHSCITVDNVLRKTIARRVV